MRAHELTESLGEAAIPILLMVLVHLTGERRWIQPPFRPDRAAEGFDDQTGGLDRETQALVRDAVARALAAPAQPVDIDDELLADMMSACVGEPVGPEYVPVMLEDMGLRERPPRRRVTPVDGELPMVIIGAGFSGVCLGKLLDDVGIPFVILERADSPGGTWWSNRYPEAGVDTPSHLYSFSFAPNLAWSRYFPKREEILRYIEDCIDRFGLRDRIRLQTSVTEARFDEDAQRWEVDAVGPDGPETLLASAVITAVGQLTEPKYPAIPGLEDFGGRLVHTARWPDDIGLAGKRVAVVGTGASAMQVARTTAEAAEHLTIYQRSPQWVAPNPLYLSDISPAVARLFAEVPFYMGWYRFVLFWRFGDPLHASIVVEDDWPHKDRAVSRQNDRHRRFLERYILAQLEGRPDLVAKAVPTYPAYGKRMLLDNEWFKTLRRDDVELVVDPIARIERDGVVTEDGARRAADVLVMATGFQSTRILWPTEIRGRGGQSIHDAWRGDDPRAYLGLTTVGFPNLFIMLGPNTALAHGGSAIFQIEAQAQYLVSLLVAMREAGVATVEPRQDVHDDYNDRVDAANQRLVFAHPGMSNWYKNAAGRVVSVSPWRLVDFWHMTRKPDLADYVTHARTPREEVA